MLPVRKSNSQKFCALDRICILEDILPRQIDCVHKLIKQGVSSTSWNSKRSFNYLIITGFESTPYFDAAFGIASVEKLLRVAPRRATSRKSLSCQALSLVLHSVFSSRLLFRCDHSSISLPFCGPSTITTTTTHSQQSQPWRLTPTAIKTRRLLEDGTTMSTERRTSRTWT